MLGKRYVDVMRGQLDKLEGQLEHLSEVADRIAERLATGGALHIHDTGHLLNQELVNRAGGLMAMTPLQYSFSVHNPVSAKHAARPPIGETDSRLAVTNTALDASQVRAEDVLIIGSVSGRAANVVDLALRARERGTLVVALTSLTYSGSVTSKHPSGKRLFEAAEIAIDNGAIEGDACLEVEGLPVRAVPTSGVGAAITAWALVAEVIEKLLARGITPTVYASANLDWGQEFNDRAKHGFDESGI
ncbi:MAG: sugar isomerase domain-containing protein [candidate division WS1 bacterium]|jgi:uncharacterized phosphosugar-binding protein|nr:sugar isomerase domain-containing protein [candidate division WS1 bacterium]